MTRLHRLLRPALAVLLVVAVAAPAASARPGPRDSGPDRGAGCQGARPAAYTLPGDTVFPEGVAYDEARRTLFVSSTTDGTVFRAGLCDAAATPFLTGGADGRTTAIGLKVDRAGRLFVAGGGTGKLFVYETRGERAGSLIRVFDTGNAPNTFINDVALTRNGDAYFTDSITPVIYRVRARDLRGEGVGTPESFLPLDGTPIVYGDGFNLNGIQATPDGRYLVTVQSSTGSLYRVDTQTKRVDRIRAGRYPNGDGLLLSGRTLYVAQNADGVIAQLRLDRRLLTGRLVRRITDPSLRFPTTLARLPGNRLAVVNSQFDKRSAGQPPELPFTVSAIRPR